MKVSLNWLRSLVDIELPTQQLVDDLSMLGLETEKVETFSRTLSGIVVAKVMKCEQLPDSDHLQLCSVDIGGNTLLQVVCGAPNITAGQTVPLAQVGAELAGGMKIRKAKVRGAESNGMICSEKELELGEDHSGIMVLDDDLEAGQPLAELWGYEDTVLDLEITQNRGDCLSIIGVARELAARYEIPLNNSQKTVPEVSQAANEAISVEIEKNTTCGRYAARVIRDIEVKPSPRWMQDRLLAVGLRPINNVVDVTNYILWHTGHPLHAFDMRNIIGSKIKVRFAGKDEAFLTLDEEERRLDPEVLLICDEKKPVAIGGIMGGLDSGIVIDTKEILIECAWFDPVNIRMSSRRLGLVSDSSRRFERGVDPNDIEYVLDLAATLILETAGGEVLKGIVDEYPQPRFPLTITVRPDRVNQILGMEIPSSKQQSLLRRLQFNVEEKNDHYLVEVPTYRFDLDREIDVIEEIIRLYGYSRIPSAVRSLIPLKPWIDKLLPVRSDLREMAVRAGLQEVSTYSMISQNQHDQTSSRGEVPIKVINPISEDLAVVRTSMLPSLLLTAAHNLNRNNSSISIFEVGRTFHLNDETYNNSRENFFLAVLLTGVRQIKTWTNETSEYDFYDIKGVAELFLARFDTSAIKRVPEVDSRFTGNSYQLSAEGQPVLSYGELSSDLAAVFGIEQSVYYLEMNLSHLQKHFLAGVKLNDVSRFPDNLRDLSFLVEESTAIGDLIKTIRSSGGKHLRYVEFFDLYRGKGIETGWKSASYNLCFNSQKGSLEDDQVDRYIKNIVKAVAVEHNGRLR